MKGTYNERPCGILRRMPGALRTALFYALQWTWGLPQNLLGLILMLILGKQERRMYHCAAATLFRHCRLLPDDGAFSLGMFIFIPLEWGEDAISKTIVHEYGHTVQSMILGPLYLPAAALPSVIWAQVWPRSRRKAYRALERAREEHALQLRSGNTGASNESVMAAAHTAKRLQTLEKRAERRYTSHYPENWANALGRYATGETPVEN